MTTADKLRLKRADLTTTTSELARLQDALAQLVGGPGYHEAKTRLESQRLREQQTQERLKGEIKQLTSQLGQEARPSLF